MEIEHLLQQIQFQFDLKGVSTYCHFQNRTHERDDLFQNHRIQLQRYYRCERVESLENEYFDLAPDTMTKQFPHEELSKLSTVRWLEFSTKSPLRP